MYTLNTTDNNNYDNTEPESTVNGTTVSLDYNNISTNGSNIVCAENYYVTDDGACMPLCSLWVDPLHGAFDANNIAILISVVTAVLSAIILLIISLSVQRKFMYITVVPMISVHHYRDMHTAFFTGGDFQHSI